MALYSEINFDFSVVLIYGVMLFRILQAVPDFF